MNEYNIFSFFYYLQSQKQINIIMDYYYIYRECKIFL